MEIDEFKKFNKIKALTNNSEVIAEAVSKSDFFEVSYLKGIKFNCLMNFMDK